jgi:hypothetical protein
MKKSEWLFLMEEKEREELGRDNYFHLNIGETKI